MLRSFINDIVVNFARHALDAHIWPLHWGQRRFRKKSCESHDRPIDLQFAHT